MSAYPFSHLEKIEYLSAPFIFSSLCISLDTLGTTYNDFPFIIPFY